MRRASASMRGIAAVLLLGSALPACGGESGPGASGEAEVPLLLEGARIIVGDGTVVEGGALLLEGDRISAIGRAGEVDLPAGAMRVDLSGRTVIPALVDGHAHLGYEGYTGWGAAHYSRRSLVDHLHRYAYYGFGAVFSAGSDPEDLALELQEDQRAGNVGGARFLFGAGLAPPGQGPNDRFLEHTRALSVRMGATVVRGAATAEEGRRQVGEVAAKGIPVIKIWVDDRGGSQDKLAPDVYRAVMDEAELHGVEVVVHQQDAADMPDLVRAGASGFLHGRLGPELDDEVAALLSGSGTFVVPNLGLGELRGEDVFRDPFLRGAVSPAVVERLAAAWEARAAVSGGGASPGPSTRERELRAAMARLLDAGVPIVLGTDAGAVPDHFFGYTGHRELEIFVRLGMTPMQALVSATGTAARALGLPDTGTLEPGKSADFVVLDADPLEDIRNTRQIVDVYLRGRRVDREALRARWTGADTSPSP